MALVWLVPDRRIEKQVKGFVRRRRITPNGIGLLVFLDHRPGAPRATPYPNPEKTIGTPTATHSKLKSPTNAAPGAAETATEHAHRIAK
jgi:hypothetical protein